MKREKFFILELFSIFITNFIKNTINEIGLMFANYFIGNGGDGSYMVKKIVRDPLFLAQKSVDATEEGCLSLEGVRPCTIQHEVDHCNGIVI